MADERKERAQQPAPDDPRRESGKPGGGQGRVDIPGKTGIYPGTGPFPPGDAPIQWAGSMGQDRPEGYQDSGDSETGTVLRMHEQYQREQQEKAKKEKEKEDNKT